MTPFPWTRTWPDDPNNQHDWRVKAENLADRLDMMRIYKVTGGSNDKRWYWTSSRLEPPGADGLRQNRQRDGYCDTAKEARMAAEEAYGPLNERDRALTSAAGWR